MMKKLLSVLLIAALCLSSCIFTASASAYPESAHDYANNCKETWEYTYPEPAEALYVTFSAKTYFAPAVYIDSVTRDDPPEVRQDVLYNGFHSSGPGDRLRIYDAGGNRFLSAEGDDLSGRTICLDGNSFTLELETDATGTAYGFSIDRISPQAPEEFVTVCYHMSDKTLHDIVPAGETVTPNERYGMIQDGSRIVVGWKSADGREWFCDNVPDLTGDESAQDAPAKSDLVAEAGKTVDLYPLYCNISMTKDEVFSFTNSPNHFDNSYHFTRTHYLHLFTDWIATFSLTPLAPVAILVNAFFTLLWPTLDFAGSCCGFPVAELLQHYGKIDILSRQGVRSVSELQPDDELVSTISFYNVHAAACHPVNHVGIERGTAAYSEQLHALYDTLENGNPVYFEFYAGSRHPMQSLAIKRPQDIFKGAHGILLTGAYTDDKGNHILIACDCNSLEYARGRCDIVYINPDFTNIWHGWSSSPLDGFSWNDSVDQFDSFPAEGIPNPLAWHIELFKNGSSAIKQIVSLLSRTHDAK